MPRRPRRNHSAAFKAKVALAAIQGDKTLSQLAEDFEIHANEIIEWKYLCYFWMKVGRPFSFKPPVSKSI